MAPISPAVGSKIGEEDNSLKRANKGFNVGPQNLPDGTHRRKGKVTDSERFYNANVR